jgi:Zinc carboxypeptidase
VRFIRLLGLGLLALPMQWAPRQGAPIPAPLPVVSGSYPTGPCDEGLPGLNGGPQALTQIGTSVQGRPIYAEQHGYGGNVIVVVGQVHGNECAPQLVTEAVRQHGWTGTTVWLIPTLNPDGYANGTRTNANGVDLNRDGHAMSQPESAALRDFVANVGATLVVHVHSPSNFAGYYGGSRARDLAAAYAANVGISFRGPIANHPFLWLGHAGQTVLVELPAIGDHDAAGASDNRTTASVDHVRWMSAALAQILGASGGSGIGDGPSATSSNPNQIHVIVRGQDSVPYLRHFDGSAWGPYTSLGGLVDGQPAIVSRSPGTLDVFIRGIDGALWTRWFDGSGWSDWTSLGGYLSTPPAAVSRAPGTIDVFVGGADGALWTRRLDGSAWSGWEYLGGLVTATPAAASPRHGDITVFVRGRDRGLWAVNHWGGAWSQWVPLGGTITAAPAATSRGGDTFDVFGRGLDGALWTLWYDGASWSAWTSLGGQITSPPAAASPNSSTVAVFVRGQDSALWNRSMTGGWGAWASLGGQIT